MSATALGIVSGSGSLPRLVADACAASGRDYRIVTFEGIEPDWVAGRPQIRAVFEKPGRLFGDLRKAGIGEVCFAGGMARPSLNPARFDLKGLKLAGSLFAALGQGDDAALRIVARLFEDEGFRVVAAQDLLGGLVAKAGVLTKARPGKLEEADAERGMAILAALAPVDVGQAVVVAGGICLGVESIQGTDALLRFVAATPAGLRPEAKGVLVKALKAGQDRRMDLPAIGPGTMELAAAAGLAGVVVEAGGVLVLGDAETVAAADRLGLFLWGREAG